jgi:hypothetical protein
VHTNRIVSNVTVVAFLALPLVLVFLSGWSGFFGAASVESNVTCWVLIVLASVVAAVSLYLSFLRPFLYAKRHGNATEGYRHVSGIPIVGSIFAALAVLVAWGQMSVAAAGLTVLLVDTGGVVWLLSALSHDRSFWERAA